MPSLHLIRGRKRRLRRMPEPKPAPEHTPIREAIASFGLSYAAFRALAIATDARVYTIGGKPFMRSYALKKMRLELDRRKEAAGVTSYPPTPAIALKVV